MSARTENRPRRGLNLIEAALYVGISPDKFTHLMETGRMPKPKLIDDKRVWDVEAIDAYFRALPDDQRTQEQRQRGRQLPPEELEG